MVNATIVRSIVPILLLIGIGFLARKKEILKAGDERVLSAYVYYFALPALFFVNMAETSFTGEIFRFIAVGIIPILISLGIYTFIYLAFRLSKDTLYLLILSTIFGSLAFFGIPFIMFAFPTRQGETLATLSAASISIIGVIVSITVLELYKLEKTKVLERFKVVFKRLSKNPLIISIILGIIVSLVGAEIPYPISASLHMLGGTTSTVAIFMLGAFLFGRKYKNMGTAFLLSLLRTLFLPSLTFIIATLLNLSSIEMSVSVLMNGMPVAISMIILSERYDFYQETIASTILISSLGAVVYLNLWLLLLGHY